MRSKLICAVALAAICLLLPNAIRAQPSVARRWNEALLESIRNDFARPTIHARNLFHVSAAMYDAWAVYDEAATPYFLNHGVDGFFFPFFGVPEPSNRQEAREQAISYAAYRILRHRFQYAPDSTRDEILQSFDELMRDLGFDASFTSTDYTSGSPAALGNFIADRVIAFGMQDGSNEAELYSSRYYEPVNPELDPVFNGNPDMVEPNRWQPLRLREFVGQGGFAGTPSFLSPEWGEVSAFALSSNDLQRYRRDGYEFQVYHDPGPPPLLATNDAGYLSEEYQWGFALVGVWSGHLDPTDGVLWNISPGSIGNIESIPNSVEEYREFYDLLDGGDPGPGWETNPHTGQPYAPQLVPRGDYTRVLAEFWADGPDSETPPGHWFTILNYVSEHPEFEPRYRGEGPLLDPLEWDVKAYFALGGAMHDAAVTAWGIKGWYDYVRPVSAIRYMADHGQSSDPARASYHPQGIPLVEGAIELIEPGDPLAGPEGSQVGKIKLRAWRGPRLIVDPESDVAGVDWIRAEQWWPYQRPTFVSPPFAGYVSGHSVFSRAAAEMMTVLTGDAFFPGGLGEFHAQQNEFLVFEDGPSVDVTLQWATYRDASDQTSLSRIWGGIHPPADDLPGRHLGIEIAMDAFVRADEHFQGTVDATASPQPTRAFPNPVGRAGELTVSFGRPAGSPVTFELYTLRGRLVRKETRFVDSDLQFARWPMRQEAAGVYLLRLRTNTWEATQKFIYVR